jgi:hypothetical protein
MAIQIDVNVLLGIHQKDPDYIAYVQANRANGLRYNEAAANEFLVHESPAELQNLEQTFGLSRIQDVTLAEIDVAGQLLQDAFLSDPWGRIIHENDARVAATAFIKKEKLATGDLKFFKRGLDLGLQMEFIGSGNAKAKALAYVTKPVQIPKP